MARSAGGGLRVPTTPHPSRTPVSPSTCCFHPSSKDNTTQARHTRPHTVAQRYGGRTKGAMLASETPTDALPGHPSLPTAVGGAPESRAVGGASQSPSGALRHLPLPGGGQSPNKWSICPSSVRARCLRSARLLGIGGRCVGINRIRRQCSPGQPSTQPSRSRRGAIHRAQCTQHVLAIRGEHPTPHCLACHRPSIHHPPPSCPQRPALPCQGRVGEWRQPIHARSGRRKRRASQHLRSRFAERNLGAVGFEGTSRTCRR